MSPIPRSGNAPQQLIRDQQLRTTLAVAVLGATSVFALCLLLAFTGGYAGPVDRHVFDMVINHRGQFLIDVATSFVALGEAVPLLVICLLWGALMVPQFSGESKRLTKRLFGRASVPLLVLIATAVVVAILKQVIGRAGPSDVLLGSRMHSLALAMGVLVAALVLAAADRSIGAGAEAPISGT